MTTVDKLSPLSRELLDRADSIFNKISQSAASVGNAALEQMPSIAYEFILFNRVYYTALFLVCIVAIFAGVKLIIKGEKYVSSHWSFMPTAGIGIVLFVPAVTLMLQNFKSLIMVWVAPKIFLITQIVNITKDIVK